MTIKREEEKMGQKVKYHLLCLTCIFIWGLALISTTRIQEAGISPEVLMFWRFLIGYGTLWLLYPKAQKLSGKLEIAFLILCGFTGVTLYFGCQNEALTFTAPAYVSIIVSMAPFFTAVLDQVIIKHEKISFSFFMGFLICIVGIVMVTTAGSSVQGNGILGNLLALTAALSWAVYSVFVDKFSDYPTILVTRKVFFAGLATMIPLLLLTGHGLEIPRVFARSSLPHILYMGVLASGVCYLLWNESFQVLGSLSTNVYLYLLPVATMFCSWLLMHSRFNLIQILGVMISVAGLILSQMAQHRKVVVLLGKKKEVIQ